MMLNKDIFNFFPRNFLFFYFFLLLYFSFQQRFQLCVDKVFERVRHNAFFQQTQSSRNALRGAYQLVGLYMRRGVAFRVQCIHAMLGQKRFRRVYLDVTANALASSCRVIYRIPDSGPAFGIIVLQIAEVCCDIGAGHPL